MKNFAFALLTAVLFTPAVACSSGSSSSPVSNATVQTGDPTLGPLPKGDTVASVQVDAYVGTWYEVASIPRGFQRNCAATTATYGVIDENTVSVLNKCRLGGVDGAPIEIRGTAKVVDPSNAKLEVSFGFASAPYWIVDLGRRVGDAPYPWAAVSTPGRKSLWILSREPVMPKDRYDAIVARLEARGFAPERMNRTAQPATTAAKP